MGYNNNIPAVFNIDFSDLKKMDAQSATLLHGLSAITTDQATATDVKLHGRTLVNLLGRDGNCEDTSKWSSSSGGTISIDNTNYVYGTGSIKNTLSSSGALTKSKKFNIDNTKYYLFIVEISGDVASSYAMITKGTDSSELKRGNTITNSAIGAFQISYVKLSPSDLGAETSIFLNTTGNGISGNTFNTDGARLLQIPQSIYDKIDVDAAYTGDALAAKFPYVDSVQHAMNPYVKNSGKNLIPPFTSGEWTLHANAKVLEDYELELDATATNQNSYVSIPVLPKQSYTISSPTSLDSSKYFTIREYDVNGNFTSRSFISGTSYTFITASTTVSLTILTTNVGAGTFTFTNPQLELGSTATPFEPQNESYLYVAQDANKNPISLASNNDGSVADEVYQRDGQWYRLNRFIRNLVLDGSLGWNFHVDFSGFKRVYFPLTTTKDNTAIATKFDGKVMIEDTTKISTNSDVIDYSPTGGNMYFTLADTDSGWGESYTPSASEIKSYFFGWKMNNGTFGTAYTGATGDVKTWVPIGDTDNTRATTVLPASDSPTIAEGKIDHYKLTYQLAQATEEAIEVEGSLDLITGGNQLKVGEAVIVREKANPVYNGSDSYLINHTYNSTSFLQHKTDEILTIFKNGVIDKYWTIITASNAYGNQTAYILSSDYDSNAEYTVTYTALDTYKLSSAENNVEITYNTNIKTVVDSLVQKLEDAETQISILQEQMIDVLSRLQAGGL